MIFQTDLNRYHELQLENAVTSILRSLSSRPNWWNIFSWIRRVVIVSKFMNRHPLQTFWATFNLSKFNKAICCHSVNCNLCATKVLEENNVFWAFVSLILEQTFLLTKSSDKWKVSRFSRFREFECQQKIAPKYFNF